MRSGTRKRPAGLVALMTLVCAAGCASLESPVAKTPADLTRKRIIAHADVWSPTNVPAMNVRRGPTGRGAFAPNEPVTCTYVERDMDGGTPKFTCRLGSGEDVKVKYGRDNGEVYAEVAASRLLWVLGFGADQMYPVRIRCRGCPFGEKETAPSDSVLMIEAAAVERKMPGRELKHDDGSGWAWSELDDIDASQGGASIAERDALKLLAAVIQHTDSKKEQQRIVCLGRATRTDPCPRPFMMISDVGKTFGRASAFNRDAPSSVNRAAWAEATVWAPGAGCRANIARSATGTLDHPQISEAGRALLSRLLHQLTDTQLRDLFSVSRFPMRAGVKPGEEAREIQEWVSVFKDKVRQIDARTCPAERAS